MALNPNKNYQLYENNHFVQTALSINVKSSKNIKKEFRARQDKFRQSNQMKKINKHKRAFSRRIAKQLSLSEDVNMEPLDCYCDDDDDNSLICYIHSGDYLEHTRRNRNRNSNRNSYNIVTSIKLKVDVPENHIFTDILLHRVLPFLTLHHLKTLRCINKLFDLRICKNYFKNSFINLDQMMLHELTTITQKFKLNLINLYDLESKCENVNNPILSDGASSIRKMTFRNFEIKFARKSKFIDNEEVSIISFDYDMLNRCTRFRLLVELDVYTIPKRYSNDSTNWNSVDLSSLEFLKVIIFQNVSNFVVEKSRLPPSLKIFICNSYKKIVVEDIPYEMSCLYLSSLNKTEVKCYVNPNINILYKGAGQIDKLSFGKRFDPNESYLSSQIECIETNKHTYVAHYVSFINGIKHSMLITKRIFIDKIEMTERKMKHLFWAFVLHELYKLATFGDIISVTAVSIWWQSIYNNGPIYYSTN